MGCTSAQTRPHTDTHATQQEERPITKGYNSTQAGPHTKRLKLQKRKHSRFRKQQFQIPDDDHIGRNM
jgi:hypothetical protein